MAVAYVAGATANHNQSSVTTTAAVTIPAGAAAGQTALFCMVQNSGSSTLSAPAGWTLMRGPDTINSNVRAAIWKKDLVSGDPGTTVNFTSDVGARLPGAMLVFSGSSAADTTIVEMATVTSASTSLTSPSITTTVNGSMIAGFWCLRDATASPSPDLTVPATHTARAVAKTNFGASPNFTVQSSHRTATVSAGTYGGSTATATEASTAIIYYVALAPVLAPPPVASFTATPTTGTAPLSVNFTDTSTGSPTSWAWNFGDGDTSTLQNPTHSYASAGTYTVNMTATNAAGSDAATTATITVSAAASGGAGGLHLFALRGGTYVALTPYAPTA